MSVADEVPYTGTGRRCPWRDARGRQCALKNRHAGNVDGYAGAWHALETAMVLSFVREETGTYPVVHP